MSRSLNCYDNDDDTCIICMNQSQVIFLSKLDIAKAMP